jgi:prepilin-type N-terminal cleavage/methylation domain-containing protein
MTSDLPGAATAAPGAPPERRYQGDIARGVVEGERKAEARSCGGSQVSMRRPTGKTREAGGMFLRREGGFTLIELMIVVIVIGVLAGVAIPLYQIVPERSKSTEANAALGLVKEAMRTYYAEHGTYANANFTDGAPVTAGGILSITDEDFDGRYFSPECYTFDGAPGAWTFRIKCDGSASTAAHGSDVSTVVMTIDQSGETTRAL